MSGIIPADIPSGWVQAISEPVESRADALLDWTLESRTICDEPVKSIIIGSGTGCKEIKKRLVRYFEIEIRETQEKFTTLKARGLYWKLHPPAGFWRLVPTSVRIPPRDIDDLAAWAIALQMIEKGEM